MQQPPDDARDPAAWVARMWSDTAAAELAALRVEIDAGGGRILPPDPAPARPRLAAALAAASIVLAACGGGGDATEHDRFVGPPDCVNRPELCT